MEQKIVYIHDFQSTVKPSKVTENEKFLYPGPTVCGLR